MKSISKPLHYIIIEDEMIARRGLLRQLQSFPALQCIGAYENVEDALLVIKNQEVDLAFVDIHLPEQCGLQFAQQMTGKMQFVFTTAYAQYALDSFEFDTIDYLIKPITKPQLERTVGKILRYFQSALEQKEGSGYIFVRANRKLNRVILDEIAYIEGMKDYVIIHTIHQKLITAMNIKTILSQLPEYQFVRVNKSFAVNLSRIDSLDNHSIWILGNEISLGISYRDEVMNIIKRNALNK
ncbi:response regulator of the LytR/AlgR family [Chryseobacterium sp. StRB126]|uniref:LytR/AlgR family response regulator transcription factor n=1 Tax=Chryseobacterium sp. StRB126 TaxID=878220 RepID=UPI0004E99864|nr:LytTR family DNA-binding domain-containing protein [Chryseobacterium sp. StRB126]BAP32310.1 response regulator of the LytR/AlgR family [Chryseobacterium sp. StRB126]